MDVARIRELLEPFLPAPLPPAELADISIYIELLVRWNARINLTAVRRPEEIVTRHFGESLFAAAHLYPAPPPPGASLLDFGSGAGFPGLVIKLHLPALNVTLVESRGRKATFLREVIRALTLTDIDVYAGRAEQLPPGAASTVTLRAVESFEQALPGAARLLAPSGCLALMIGSDQVATARRLLPALAWAQPLPIPLSGSRVLFFGKNPIR